MSRPFKEAAFEIFALVPFQSAYHVYWIPAFAGMTGNLTMRR